MRDHLYFLYMLASKPYGTLYVGVTNDIVRRVTEHRTGQAPGFTKKYGVRQLVWYERHRDVNRAIEREKKLKRWRREWKIQLIEAENPRWADLYPSLIVDGSRIGAGAPSGMTAELKG